MKILLLLLILPTLLWAASDAEKIAKALEERLTDALDFDSTLEDNVHSDTKLRRFEDGNPMWLQFFVRPAQNRNFHNYYGKGFKTGQYSGLFTNISNISSSAAFEMYHESPWSYKFSGIGKFFFYHKANFQDLFYSRISSNDRPKLYTFGSDNNARNCRCSHAQPNCNRNQCGHREVIGSVKFCPGVATYAGANYVGTPHTYSKCNPRPRGSYCFSNVEGSKSRHQSFHFDALIDRVYFYTDKNCKGSYSWYSYQKQKGTVSQISSYVKNKVKSIKIVFKDSRYNY